MADRLYLGIVESTGCATPLSFVTPGREGFVSVSLDASIAEAADSAEFSQSLMDGSIRPEILAIEEGRTKNDNIYVAKALMGGRTDEDGNPSGVASWYTPFPKPILINHDISVDPLGRVRGPGDAKAVKVGGKTRILIYPTITQPEAIGKVMRGEYLTGSVGVTTDSAKCSVCGHDFLSDMEWCDHMKGRKYNKEGKPDPKGEKCGWLIGNVWNKEYSMVNSPARYNSGILRLNTKEAEEFYQGGEIVLTSEQLGRKSVCYGCCGDDSHHCDGKGKCQTEASEFLYVIRVPEHHKVWSPGSVGQSNKEEADMSLILATDTVEAKLSTDARKKLPDSAFCGPGRSYPAHDAAHVRNGLARLSQFGGHGSGGKILACLRSRASKFGVSVGKKSGTGKSESFGPGEEAVKAFDAMAEGIGLTETLKQIQGMSEEAIKTLLSKPWEQPDRDEAVAGEKAELKAEEDFLKSLPEAVFCGPGRSFPVPNETYAAIAKAVLTWPSTMEQITKEQRSKILGKIEAQEEQFEEGALKGVTIEYPVWAQEDDYVSASILIERTVLDCVAGLKKGQGESDPTTSTTEADPKTCTCGKGEGCSCESEIKIEGVNEAAIAQLQEQLALSQESNKTLRAEKEALTAKLQEKDVEVGRLQEMNQKLGADAHKELVAQTVELKKAAGDKRTDEKLIEYYSAMSMDTLKAVAEELKEQPSVKLPATAKPEYSTTKVPSGPGVSVENAGGQPQVDEAKQARVARFAEIAESNGALEAPEGSGSKS